MLFGVLLLGARVKKFIGAMIAVGALLLSGCGFHLPNQAKLDETMPKINVSGDYHHQFYKMVVNRLRANGVEVYAQDSDFFPNLNENIPSLMLPAPQVQDEVVSVNSRAQSIESALLVSIAATLSIPNHRPILMRNSITRSALNKPGQSLASDTEKDMVIQETYAQLADELVMRLSYLGRLSDPDAYAPVPAELVSAIGEEEDPSSSARVVQQHAAGLTLMEALQLQAQYESANATSVTYEQLNNGQAILNQGQTTPVQATTNANGEVTAAPAKSYKLPPVQPEPLHRAPSHLY